MKLWIYVTKREIHFLATQKHFVNPNATPFLKTKTLFETLLNFVVVSLIYKVALDGIFPVFATDIKLCLSR